VISHRFRSTTDCVESVVALNRWDNAWFSQILMTRGMFPRWQFDQQIEDSFNQIRISSV